MLKANADDQGSRRFIMIQLPEPCEEGSAAAKAGFSDISAIGKERLRRAGANVTAAIEGENEDLDIGFRVLKIDTSNMKDVYYRPDAITQDDLYGQIDNIKPDRRGEDLLFQVMLDWGLDLALPIQAEIIVGKTVYFVDGDDLAACFEAGIDEEFVKQLAQRKPLRAVFRDTGYGSDNTKINVAQIFRLISPNTDVKSI